MTKNDYAGSSHEPPLPPADPRSYVLQPACTCGHHTPQTITTVVQLGPEPTHMICPHCHAEIDSSTRLESSIENCLLGIFLCILLTSAYGLCCLLPCFYQMYADIEHYCPKCKASLGTYKRPPSP